MFKLDSCGMYVCMYVSFIAGATTVLCEATITCILG
jgi:hypothetical protein